MTVKASAKIGDHSTNATGHSTHRSICYDDTSGGDTLDNREL